MTSYLYVVRLAFGQQEILCVIAIKQRDAQKQQESLYRISRIDEITCTTESIFRKSYKTCVITIKCQIVWIPPVIDEGGIFDYPLITKLYWCPCKLPHC